MTSLLAFIKNRQAVVVVETALTFPVLVLLIVMIIDFGNIMLDQSKLERTNLSLASIFRERNTFYEGEENLDSNLQKTQTDIDELTLLARRLMGSEDLSVIVNAIYFKNAGTENAPIQAVDREFILSSSFNNYRCINKPSPIQTHASLSPLSQFRKGKAEPYMPLYRITLCMKGESSWFKKAFKGILATETGKSIAEELSVSNIVIPR